MDIIMIDGSKSCRSECDEKVQGHIYIFFSLLQSAECEMRIFIAYKTQKMAIEWAFILPFLDAVLTDCCKVRKYGITDCCKHCIFLYMG